MDKVIVLSGRGTFFARVGLAKMGGEYDQATRAWTIPAEHASAARGLVDLLTPDASRVAEKRAPKLAPVGSEAPKATAPVKASEPAIVLVAHKTGKGKAFKAIGARWNGKAFEGAGGWDVPAAKLQEATAL